MDRLFTFMCLVLVIIMLLNKAADSEPTREHVICLDQDGTVLVDSIGEIRYVHGQNVVLNPRGRIPVGKAHCFVREVKHGDVTSE